MRLRTKERKQKKVQFLIMKSFRCLGEIQTDMANICMGSSVEKKNWDKRMFVFQKPWEQISLRENV